MMEAASTSETSAIFYQTTRRNNPEEDSHLQKFFCQNKNVSRFEILYKAVKELL
jgi:hypothetical protein